MLTFALIYIAFLLCVLLAVIIICFHLLRYSLDAKIARMTTILFLIITTALIVINFYFFTNVPFEELRITPSSTF